MEPSYAIYDEISGKTFLINKKYVQNFANLLCTAIACAN